jgi:hypothetical protein
VVGATLVRVGSFSIGMGGCHSAGGFCASEFSDELAWALATGGATVTVGFLIVPRLP